MQFYETIPVKILLQKLPAKILSLNQITGLFDHQYLWDQSINVSYFLGDSYEVTVVLRIRKMQTKKNSVFGHFSPSVVTSKPVTATYTKGVFG